MRNMNRQEKFKKSVINDKIEADAQWDKIKEETLRGTIYLPLIANAMNRCNFCDYTVLRECPKYREMF